MSDGIHEISLVDPGPRPPFYLVADHLWGKGCNVDADGNSATRDATDWTELTLILRPDYQARVDVDPVEGAQVLTLRISSEQELLARRAAVFLAAHSGGTLTSPRG
jgi:hypothetical protein